MINKQLMEHLDTCSSHEQLFKRIKEDLLGRVQDMIDHMHAISHPVCNDEYISGCEDVQQMIEDYFWEKPDEDD